MAKSVPATWFEPLDEAGRRRRVRHGGGVVRHLGPEPDGGEAGVGEALLEDGLDAGGHVDGAPDEADRGGQLVGRRRWPTASTGRVCGTPAG